MKSSNGREKKRQEGPITLMLVGGGFRLSTFIGALAAIEDKGLEVKRVIGASAGSVVGCLYATGMTPPAIQKLVTSADPSKFKDFSLRTLVSGKGLYAGDALEAWLDEALGGRRFSDDFVIPPTVVATDMLNRTPILLSRDTFPDLKLSQAVRFSAGMPLVFGYKEVNEEGKRHIFVDGSLMASIVEDSIEQQGNSLILKVLSRRSPHRFGDGGFTLRRYATDLLTMAIHALEREFLKGGKWKSTILLYAGDISPTRFVLTGHEKEFLFDQGYQQTKKYLEYKWEI